MGMFSKRIQAAEINIGANGRNYGDKMKIFELDRKNLIVRDVKTLRTSVDTKYDLRTLQIDIFKGSEMQSGDIVGDALAGGMLFGGVGAVVGAKGQND